MAIKTAIQAHIDTELASASSIPASKHRGVLGTNTDSILENIYMTPIVDVSSTSEVITTSNANFSYTVKFTKIGRTINISGSFKNISGGVLTFTPIFEITDTEYDNDDLVKSTARITTVGDGSEIAISISTTNELQSKDAILDNESFNFNFNYNSAN